jgi:hypothetical protein
MGTGLILLRREPDIVGQQHGSRELMWLFSGISGISVRLSPRYPSFTRMGDSRDVKHGGSPSPQARL